LKATLTRVYKRRIEIRNNWN